MKSKEVSATAARLQQPKGNKRTPREIVDPLYLTILRKALQEHSATYSEFSVGLGYLRSRDFTRLYDWAGSLTEVSYESADKHFTAYQLCALIKKYPWSRKAIPGLDPKGQAKLTFLEGERHCAKTNRRFSKRTSLYRSRFFPLLEEMKHWIRYVLGQEPNMDRIYEHCGHGSGASLGVHGNATNLHRKIGVSEYTCTSRSVSYAIEAIWRNPQMACLFLAKETHPLRIACLDRDELAARIIKRLLVTDRNKVSFVPKTAATDRSIAVEALLTTYVQRGIDAEMRRLLLQRAAIDLTNQDRNAELARLGSIDQSFGTIDLKNASNTVARRAVWYLLPPSWFALLLKTRSPQYSCNGDLGDYNMFSSMGNAFTFPLETLIFAAAARAAMRATGCWGQSWAVYGDDIVVPKDAFQLTCTLLKFLGFTPNLKKSFGAGPFRESCGSDWYQGQDVRPVNLDFKLTGTPEKMIFHNATLRSERCENFFASIRPLLRGSVPGKERFVRPDFRTPVKKNRLDDLTQQRNLNGAFTVPLDVVMVSEHAKWNRAEQRWGWKEFQFIPVADTFQIDPRGSPMHESFESMRESISFLAFLSGNLGGVATLRYEAKRLVTAK